MIAGVLLLVPLLARVVFGADLVHIQAIWRHGDRTPEHLYGGDPNTEDTWPVPFGDLTPRGMYEHYIQGLKLKARYIDYFKLVNATYHKKEIYVQSTNYDRTIQSALSHVAGFYHDSTAYPKDSPYWPKNWSPVPVHMNEDSKSDHLLNPLRKCPRMTQLLGERLSKPKYLEYMAAQQGYFDQIYNACGTKIVTLQNLHHFIDTVRIEKQNNRSIPAWITEEIYKTGVNIKERTDDYEFGSPGFDEPENVELVRLQGGVLLKQLIEHFSNAAKGQKYPLYHAFSAHDTTVFALLRALGAKINIIGYQEVQFAATVILELWKQSDSYLVRLQYSRSATSPFKTWTRAISGCPENDYCPLEDFIKRSQDYLVDDLIPKRNARKCLRLHNT
ncbi:hypothetical protein L596_015910 [Steinernema carpocapsae]|uniref:Histidine acid phosphatase n=1 Tax=Steinernema carpocapsae TaxID=34508 RepID=A0A4U5NGD3_STECR|nr:hypothetical protein L596_015910 [Steinernema carpocapsae]